MAANLMKELGGEYDADPEGAEREAHDESASITQGQRAGGRVSFKPSDTVSVCVDC